MNPTSGASAPKIEQRKPSGDRNPTVDRALLQRLVREPERYASAPSDLVSRIHDPRAVVDTLEAMSGSVQRELLSAVSGGPYRPDQLRASQAVDEHLLNRGVTVRCLHSSATAAEPQGAAVLRELVSSGAEIRVADAIAHRLILADRTLAVVPIDPNTLARGALAIREPVMIRSLLSLFRSQWENATPVADLREHAAVHVADDERQVLEMIAEGVTDEVAAKKLDVSLRTYRRRVARIMERLDAKSRFQAGVRAVERGWI